MAKPKTSSNINIPDEMIRKLLTPAEIRMLKNRWQILNLLEDGLSIRKIAERVKVGTDTVVRVTRMAEKVGLRKMLDTNNSRIKTSTSWIFGKSG